jgi:hypothetical protein
MKKAMKAVAVVFAVLAMLGLVASSVIVAF